MPLAIISRGVGIVLGAALVAAGLAFYGLIVFQMTKFVVHGVGAVADFINSKRQTAWTNRSGQDIQSTVLQKKSCSAARKESRRFFIQNPSKGNTTLIRSKRNMLTSAKK